MRRRLLPAAGRAILLLLGVSFLTFALGTLAPGDLVSELQLDPRIDPETVARLRVQYALDRPLVVRYVAWLASALRGELGFSLLYDQPVRQVIGARVPHTLLLTVASTALAWLAAVPVGLWLAGRRGGWPDRFAAGVTSALVAVPEVLLALLALWFAVASGWFPAGGRSTAGIELAGGLARWRDAAWHLVLPASVLALGLFPVLLRHVRAAALTALETPAILTARARGLRPSRLLGRHALWLAAPSLAPLAGLSLAGLLSGSLAVEVVFGWPGLGPLLVEATLARDLHLVTGATTLAAGLLAIGTGMTDLAARWLDPRSDPGDRA